MKSALSLSGGKQNLWWAELEVSQVCNEINTSSELMGRGPAGDHLLSIFEEMKMF